MSLFAILSMVFLHIIDDFFIQSCGFLAMGKQRGWWEKNAPDPLYKHDYIMALIMHSLSWSFSIMIPVAYSLHFDVGALFLIVFLINALVHGIVDHLKANCHALNLIQDQMIHLIQIMLTATLFIIT